MNYAPQQPYQAQYPQAPAQPPMQQPQAYAQPPMQQQYPAQYAPAPGGYPQQPYAQQPYQPQGQAPAGPPLATAGSLDDFYNQPSTASGPSISWKDKPIGHYIIGTVSRDVTVADVQQQTNPQGVPQTFKDGRPKWVMKVPLKVQPSPEHPDGEATWYVKGQAKDELVRAMAEAGHTGSPKAGANVVVQLTGKRSSGAGYNPSNVFAVRYSHDGGAPAAQPAPAAPEQQVQAPAPQQTPQPQYQAPQQMPAQQYAPQPTVDQTVQQQAATGQQPPQWAQPAAPAAQQPGQPVPGAQAPAQQYPAATAPQAAQQATPPPPSDLSPEQQQLLAGLTGGTPAGQ